MHPDIDKKVSLISLYPRNVIFAIYSKYNVSISPFERLPSRLGKLMMLNIFVSAAVFILLLILFIILNLRAWVGSSVIPLGALTTVRIMITHYNTSLYNDNNIYKHVFLTTPFLVQRISKWFHRFIYNHNTFSMHLKVKK